MVGIRGICSGLGFILALSIAATSTRPAAAAGGSPSIRITNLRDGQVVTGGTITVNVSVSNFRLVPPIYINPPKLSGNQGHIHYVLDSLANFKPRRDATIALTHTWTGIAPGPHTVEAYLATSQHAQFARAEPVKVSITLKPANATGPARRQPDVKVAPRSGGAESRPAGSPSPVTLFLAFAFIMLGALMLAGRVLVEGTLKR